MDFSLAEERRLLQDTIRRFLANEYGFDKRRARVASGEGFSRETWKEFARLGRSRVSARTRLSQRRHRLCLGAVGKSTAS